MNHSKLSGPPEMVDLWSSWQGVIDCGFTSREWSADELRKLSSKLVIRLRAEGVQPGDRVGLLLANTVLFPTSLLSLLECHCNPCLVHVASQHAEVERAVKEVGLKWLLHDFVEGLSQLAHRPEDGRTLLATDGAQLVLLCTENMASDSNLPLNAEGVVLHPTSGTYGRARYCVRNQQVAVTEGRDYTETIGCYRQARVTVTTPLSHAYAYGFGLISSMLTNSTLVLDAAFNPRSLLRRERENESDILALVPPMAKALALMAERDSARAMAPNVFYAGAPCPPTIMKLFESTFRSNLFAILGTTETGAITTNYSLCNRFAGVGPALSNVEVSIDVDEAYDSIGKNAGEICVNAPSMMQGYLMPDGVSWAGGLWHTGDVGYIDVDGSLTIVGRIKDIINLAGMKVDPAEVEAVLRDHESVKDVAVYPGHRPDGTEYMQAAVTGNVDLDALKTHCGTFLNSYKVPTVFHHVEEVPRTPSGKCLKIKLPDFPEQFIVW